MWDIVAVFVDSGVFVAYAAVEHARGFGHGFDSDRTVGMFGSGFVDGFSNLGDTWFPYGVIMVAVPHHVPRRGPGSFAGRMVASICVN